MAEPMKNVFNEAAISGMASHLKRVHPAFEADGFVKFSINNLDDLELMQRVNRITDALEHHLPTTFPDAVRILLNSLDPNTGADIDMATGTNTDAGIHGWPVMPMADYITRHGQGDLDLSLDALRQMTMRFTAEFAIRQFLIDHQTATLKTMQEWCTDDNHHVRRLASEGSRPRLPWGLRLMATIADPQLLMPILEALKDDSEEYVRRSVANSLNDIAKDHPDLVADTAKRWMKGASKDRQRMVKHALRGLIKSGHSGALAALGYGPPKVTNVVFNASDHVTLGDALDFDLSVTSDATAPQPLIIDFAIHHRKANGSLSPKVFKWKNITLNAGETLNISKRHPMRPITTRSFYSGKHKIEMLINGQSVAMAEFMLDVS